MLFVGFEGHGKTTLSQGMAASALDWFQWKFYRPKNEVALRRVLFSLGNNEIDCAAIDFAGQMEY